MFMRRHGATVTYGYVIIARSNAKVPLHFVKNRMLFLETNDDFTDNN